MILTALGSDPKALGYGVARIERALSHTLRVAHLPPEARVQRHVLYLLEKARGGRVEPGVTRETGDSAGGAEGADPAGAEGGKGPGVRFEPHPEVEGLRFDSTRAFIDTVPTPFRRAVYEILLEYSRGSLWREGSEWKPFDLLSSPEMDQAKQPRDLEFLVG